jgi:hypothetical protein
MSICATIQRHFFIPIIQVWMNFFPPTRELLPFVTAAMVLFLIPEPAVLYIVARL